MDTLLKQVFLRAGYPETFVDSVIARVHAGELVVRAEDWDGGSGGYHVHCPDGGWCYEEMHTCQVYLNIYELPLAQGPSFQGRKRYETQPVLSTSFDLEQPKSAPFRPWDWIADCVVHDSVTEEELRERCIA